MENAKYIVDNGLFSSTLSITDYEIQYEEMNTLFFTVKEYREYSSPDSPSWNAFILDIFNVLGFVPTLVSHNLFSISLNGEVNNSSVALAIIPIRNNETYKDISQLFPEGDYKQLSKYKWLVVSDGLTFEFFDLQVENSSLLLSVDLEKILTDQRIDSFHRFYRALFIIQEENSTSGIKDTTEFTPQFGHKNEFNYTTGKFPNLALLAQYKYIFEHLRVSTNANIWQECSNFSSPHKPLLLLSIINYLEKNRITENLFSLNNEIKDRFSYYWHLVYPNKSKGNPVLPFFHLQGDAIWKLLPNPGKDNTLDVLKELDSFVMLENLVKGGRFLEELFFALNSDIFRNALKVCLIEKYFSLDLRDRFIQIAGIESQKYMQVQQLLTDLQKANQVSDGHYYGYIELPYYPVLPPQDFPTRQECKNYDYITYVQLCNLSSRFGKSRHRACVAFGGDNGDYLVKPERLARTNHTKRPWKFTQVTAAEKYFNEIGLNWEQQP